MITPTATEMAFKHAMDKFQDVVRNPSSDDIKLMAQGLGEMAQGLKLLSFDIEAVRFNLDKLRKRSPQ